MQASDHPIGFFKTMQLLYRYQGISRFYRGAIPIVMGCIPAHAAFFGSYEVAKSKFHLDDGVCLLFVKIRSRKHKKLN